MPAVGHPPNISMLPILVNRYAICTVPALIFFCFTDFSFLLLFYGKLSVYFILSKTSENVNIFCR